MRQIDDLLKQKPKPAKLTDDEVVRLLREEDWRLINKFDLRRAPVRKQDIRPWT